MSLISFDTFREMAGPSTPGQRRGLSGVAPEEEFSDQPRRPYTPDDQIDLKFLDQFDTLRERPSAWHARLHYWLEFVLPKMHAAIYKEMEKLGIRESLVNYLKTGKESKSFKSIPHDFKNWIRSYYGDIEGKGLQFELAAPSSPTLAIEEIKVRLRDLDAAAKQISSETKRPIGLDDDDLRKIHVLLQRSKSLEAKGEDLTSHPDVVKELRDTALKLKLIAEVERRADMIEYEMVKPKLEDRNWWKGGNPLKADLDPETVELEIQDPGARRANRALKRKVKPYFFELYHKLERSEDKDHIDELKKMGMGPGLGYDLKFPTIEKDEKRGTLVTTFGADFGWSNPRFNDAVEFFNRWIQMNSYGFHGPVSRELSSPDSDIVFKTAASKKGGQLYEDPLYDWLFDDLKRKIRSSIKKEKKIEGGDIRTSDCEGPDPKNPGRKRILSTDECATRTAEKVLHKFIQQGGLVAPAFPCESNKKHGLPCPTADDRTYKISATGKVVRPALYIPHEVVASADGSKRYRPLIRPHGSLKSIDPEKFKDDYEKAIERVLGNFEDGTLSRSFDMDPLDDGDEDSKYVSDLLDPETGKIKAGLPGYAPVSSRGMDVGKRGAGDIYGMTFDGGTPARDPLDPISSEGRDVIRKYLTPGSNGLIPDFVWAIRSCTMEKSQCGAAPKPLKDALRASMGAVHEMIRREAKKTLSTIKYAGEADEELRDQEKPGANLKNWAKTKVSNIAQRPEKYGINLKDIEGINADFEGYTRRLGFRIKTVDTGAGPEGLASDRGYDVLDDKDLAKQRGAKQRPAYADPLKSISKDDIDRILSLAKASKSSTDNFAREKQSNVQTLSDQELGEKVREIYARSYQDKKELFDEIVKLLKQQGKSSEFIDGLIVQWRDSTVEEIIDALGAMTKEVSTPAPSKGVRPLPISPVKLKAPTSSPGLMGRVRAKSSIQPPGSIKPEDDLESSTPTVDWHFVRQLTLSERVNYLRGKLKGY